MVTADCAWSELHWDEAKIYENVQFIFKRHLSNFKVAGKASAEKPDVIIKISIHCATIFSELKYSVLEGEREANKT